VKVRTLIAGASLSVVLYLLSQSMGKPVPDAPDEMFPRVYQDIIG
jgi:hypothetical protein